MKALIDAYKYYKEDDPVYHCDLYKDQGCAHVDGMLCDFHTCSMRVDYSVDKIMDMSTEEVLSKIGTPGYPTHKDLDRVREVMLDAIKASRGEG